MQMEPSGEPSCVMTINIELRPEEERRLRERAASSGQDLSEYVHLVIKEHLEVSPRDASGKGSTTFAEVLAPVWEGFRQSGMSEDEAADFLDGELQSARRERKGQP